MKYNLFEIYKKIGANIYIYLYFYYIITPIGVKYTDILQNNLLSNKK